MSKTAPIDEETADLLEDVWERVLFDVRHPSPEEQVSGDDGTSYHAAHFEIGVGYYSGQIWSPPDGSVPGDFVELAELLRVYAGSEEENRDELMHRIHVLAVALREKLLIRE